MRRVFMSHLELIAAVVELEAEAEAVAYLLAGQVEAVQLEGGVDAAAVHYRVGRGRGDAGIQGLG